MVREERQRVCRINCEEGVYLTDNGNIREVGERVKLRWNCSSEVWDRRATATAGCLLDPPGTAVLGDG